MQVYIPPDGIPTVEYNLYLSYVNLNAYGVYFLGGDFRKSKPCLFHLEMGEELLSDSNKPLFVIVPRGHGKTTITKCSIMHDFSFTAANLKKFGDLSRSKLKSFWYEEARKKEQFGPCFSAWIAKSQDDSKRNAKYIRKHFDENQKIINFFGRMRGETWNKESLVTRDGDALMCGSNIKSVRGSTEATISHGAIRLYRVFADDCENEQNTKTQNARKEIKDTLFAGILPAIEVDKPKCRLVVTGTPVHWDSLIQNTLDDYAVVVKEGKVEKYPYKVITYKATQPSMPGGVLWNSYLPRSVLNTIKARYEVKRKLSLYYQEYELEVGNAAIANWNRQSIQFHKHQILYDEGAKLTYLLVNNDPLLVNCFLGCDPATDIETKESDYSCIVVIAVDINNRRYVLETSRNLAIPTIGQRNPYTDELIGKKGVVDIIFEMYDRYHCKLGTVEDVAMNRSVFQGILARKRLLNRFDISLVGAAPGGTNKHNRIYSYLDPLFASGLLYYRENQYNLIDETIKFGPKMAHDDEIEALFYANKNAYPPKLQKMLSKEEALKKTKKGIDLTLGRFLKMPRRRGSCWKTR